MRGVAASRGRSQPTLVRGGKGGEKRGEVDPLPTVDQEVRAVPLKDIDIADTTFRFRTELKVDELADSIADNGLQVPVVLRLRHDGRMQVVCGFRRLAALKKLGWKRCAALVRDDLNSEVDAVKVSILENEARQTYTVVDRAYAIARLAQLGMTNRAIGKMFGVGERQLQRLRKLTTFSPELQAAVADGSVPPTHAVRLMQHADKCADCDVGHWIGWIAERDASYGELDRALKAAVPRAQSLTGSVFACRKKRDGRVEVHVRKLSFDDTLPEEERAKLEKELRELLLLVEQLGGGGRP